MKCYLCDIPVETMPTDMKNDIRLCDDCTIRIGTIITPIQTVGIKGICVFPKLSNNCDTYVACLPCIKKNKQLMRRLIRIDKLS